MQESVAYCEGQFSRSGLYYWERNLGEETFDSILEDMIEVEKEEKTEENDNLVDGTEEYNGLMKVMIWFLYCTFTVFISAHISPTSKLSSWMD